jgi:hypothetical protein
MGKFLQYVAVFAFLIFIGSLFSDSDYEKAYELYERGEYNESYDIAIKIGTSDEDFDKTKDLLLKLKDKINSLDVSNSETQNIKNKIVERNIDMIFNEYEKDEEVANKFYSDKSVLISGIIKSKIIEANNYFISIGSSLFNDNQIKFNVENKIGEVLKNSNIGDSIFVTGNIFASSSIGLSLSNISINKIIPQNLIYNLKKSKSISTDKLYIDYSKNELTSDNKYLNKVFPISGFIKSIEKTSNRAVPEFDENGYVITLLIDEVLHYETRNYKINDVICYFSSTEQSKIENLKKDDYIKIVGLFVGKSKYYSSSLMMTHSLILK